MKKRKQQDIPCNQDFYETGSTKPPKKSGGVIAFLLVLVILLGGLCSALGIINMRLLEQLAQIQQEPHETLPLFKQEDNTSPATVPEEPIMGIKLPKMGAHGQTVSDFDRKFYELPHGVMVTEVQENKNADEAGLRGGDVITTVNGTHVQCHEDLSALLEKMELGETVEVEFYRQQTQEKIKTNITLREENDG